MRRDVIRGTWSAVFFPLSIPHWHFRAKTICKRRLQAAKTPENDRFLSKWEKLAWMSPLFLRAFKALLSIEIALVASYLTFPPRRAILELLGFSSRVYRRLCTVSHEPL